MINLADIAIDDTATLPCPECIADRLDEETGDFNFCGFCYGQGTMKGRRESQEDGYQFHLWHEQQIDEGIDKAFLTFLEASEIESPLVKLFYLFKLLVCRALDLRERKRHYRRGWLDTVTCAYVNVSGNSWTEIRVGYGVFRNWFINLLHDSSE